MPYRVLVATGASPAFRNQIRQRHPDWDHLDYRQQLDALLFESFGWSDAYALEFRNLGCEAETLLVGAPDVQYKWALEHGLTNITRTWKIIEAGQRTLGSQVSVLNQKQRTLLNEVFLAQVKRFRPDILLVQLQTPLLTSFLRSARQYCGLVVGQLASRFPAYLDLFGVYDWIFSAFPHYVRFFGECGLSSSYLPLAYEPVFMERCRSRFGEAALLAPEHQAVFIGSVSDMHVERLQWLDALAQSGLVDIWLSFDRGKDAASVPASLRQRSRQPVYGLEMYDVYRRARIALNAHPEISGPYAAILRMYEVTGSGCMLMTDERQNLSDLFTPGLEVVTYCDTGDCLAKLGYYLEHEDERAAIARQGQQRTFGQHLFAHRAAEILDTLKPLISRPRPH